MAGNQNWSAGWQTSIFEVTKTSSRQTRMEIMRKLLDNLTYAGVKKVENHLGHQKRKRKKSGKSPNHPPTAEIPEEDEEAWYELNEWEQLVNWASYAKEGDLLDFIFKIIPNYRDLEISQLRSSYCYHAREAIFSPERVASRRESAPTQVGWWQNYAPLDQNIFALDCEFVSKIIGKKKNGGNRCQQLAGTVSIVDYQGTVVKKWIIMHNPKDIYMTPKAREITGLNERSFVNGTELSEVKSYLDNLLNGKLLVLIGRGMDLEVLGYGMGRERHFDVFDLHGYYKKDTGVIGLRSLVIHYYKVDIQVGVHDSDIDAMYTMRLFRENYIPDKLAMAGDNDNCESTRMFNEIKTVK